MKMPASSYDVEGRLTLLKPVASHRTEDLRRITFSPPSCVDCLARRPVDPVRTKPLLPLVASWLYLDLTELMRAVGVLLLRTELARVMEEGEEEPLGSSECFLALNDFACRRNGLMSCRQGGIDDYNP